MPEQDALFDEEEWKYTPGAYIVYPVRTPGPVEKREYTEFMSTLPLNRRSAADLRRATHSEVGWKSSLKAPYRHLGTPRFDIPPRIKYPPEEERLRIRHPSRAGNALGGRRNADMHKSLETGREVMGKVAQGSYQYYMIYVPPQRILTVNIVSLTGDPDMHICNSHQFPTAKDSTWSSAEVGEDRIVIEPDDDNARPGMYYIGIHGVKESRFSIVANLKPRPRKVPKVTDSDLNGFALLREEIERAKARRLAAKRGAWLESYEAEVRAEEERLLALARAQPPQSPTSPVELASGGDQYFPDEGASGGGGLEGVPGVVANGNGGGGGGSGPNSGVAVRRMASTGSPAQPLTADPLRGRSPRRVPPPSIADLKTAVERAHVGHVEEALERTRLRAIEGRPVSSSPSLLRSVDSKGARGGQSRGGSSQRSLRGSPSGDDLRKIAPPRFYTRTLSPSGVPIRPPTAEGATPPQSPGDGILANYTRSASAAQLGSGVRPGEKAAPEEVPLEHKIAQHRSDYVRVKHEYNAKLVSSLEAMEAERAFNHRVRQLALAQIDPTTLGLPLPTLIDMIRSDAFALKTEIDRIERERKREASGGIWAQKFHPQKGSARSKLNTLKVFGGGTSSLRAQRRASTAAAGGTVGGAMGRFSPAQD